MKTCKKIKKPNRMLFERKSAKQAQRDLADLNEFRRLKVKGRGDSKRGDPFGRYGFPFLMYRWEKSQVRHYCFLKLKCLPDNSV